MTVTHVASFNEEAMKSLNDVLHAYDSGYKDTVDVVCLIDGRGSELRVVKLLTSAPKMFAALRQSTELLKDVANHLPEGGALEWFIRQQIENNTDLERKIVCEQ